MEFEDEHEEEREEDEDEDEDDEEEEEITIPPLPPSSSFPPRFDPTSPATRPRLSSERRSVAVRYRECQKNHAVGIGGHAVDGCGEFMPAGEEGSLDALKCAACNCHRNFHRKELDAGESAAATPPPSLYPHFPAYYRTPAPAGYIQRAPLALAPSTSGGTHSGEMEEFLHPSSSGGGSGGGGKKRFRTKFSQEQKDKMLAFAEKLGWRIQKHDETAVQQFCQEVQIKRQVLKVWMHNNKHTLRKKP